MLYIFHGGNSYLKERAIVELAQTLSLKKEVFFDVDEFSFGELEQAGLFAKPRLVVFDGCLKQLPFQEKSEGWHASSNHIVISENSLDKRLTATKDLLATHHAEIREFKALTPVELEPFIIEYAQQHGKHIPKALAHACVERLYPSSQTKSFTPVETDLWRVTSEVDKLIAHSTTSEITRETVDLLLDTSSQSDVFALTDAIIAKNKKKVGTILEAIYDESPGADGEKNASIKLVAVLGEQFRSFDLLKKAVMAGLSDSAIAELLGWKEARVFVIKRLSGSFSQKQISDTLQKLLALDLELKTTDLPSRVVIDLIITSLF